MGGRFSDEQRKIVGFASWRKTVKFPNRLLQFLSNLISRSKNLNSASPQTPKLHQNSNFFLRPKSWFCIRSDALRQDHRWRWWFLQHLLFRDRYEFIFTMSSSFSFFTMSEFVLIFFNFNLQFQFCRRRQTRSPYRLHRVRIHFLRCHHHFLRCRNLF